MLTHNELRTTIPISEEPELALSPESESQTTLKLPPSEPDLKDVKEIKQIIRKSMGNNSEFRVWL